MVKILNENIDKIETINLNNHKLPVIISIPHSGIYLSKNMYDNLLDNIILPNMDWYLPQLYTFLKELDFTIIINNVSRYVIDPNRSISSEIKEQGTYIDNFVYTKTTFGKEMYKIKLNKEEIENRINEFYNPYHQTIQKAIDSKLKHFNKVYLIDLHSFGRDVSADIVLGNDNGNTTSDSFLQIVNKLLLDEGFKVKNNKPYSGGYITKHYGNKSSCEALQIELWYQTYINKRDFKEEELPDICQELFENAQHNMKNFFINLSKELLKENKTSINS